MPSFLLITCKPCSVVSYLSQLPYTAFGVLRVFVTFFFILISLVFNYALVIINYSFAEVLSKQKFGDSAQLLKSLVRTEEYNAVKQELRETRLQVGLSR